ncbi:MAG: hypothetical protein ACFFB0_00655 [Promethearchaeota archaeon]
MVNFLLLIKKITYFSKKEIDKGTIPILIYELCSCIREAFCLSYSIRKDNNLYLYFEREHIIIKFKGKELRYLGPDERSQALLLGKALNKAKQINSPEYERWEKSTPGIYIKKYSDDIMFMNSFFSNNMGTYYLLLDNFKKNNKKLDIISLDKDFFAILDNDFYIISTYNFLNENTEFLELFTTLKNIRRLSIPKVKRIENIILYLNFHKDQQTNLKY